MSTRHTHFLIHDFGMINLQDLHLLTDAELTEAAGAVERSLVSIAVQLERFPDRKPAQGAQVAMQTARRSLDFEQRRRKAAPRFEKFYRAAQAVLSEAQMELISAAVEG